MGGLSPVGLAFTGNGGVAVEYALINDARFIEILPDGVDLEAFRPMAPRDPARSLVVTTGDYSWGPTRDGLLFLNGLLVLEVRLLRREFALCAGCWRRCCR